MSDTWSIIVPEAGTNYVLDPSAESGLTDVNYIGYSSATVTQDTTYARSGYRAYKIVPGGTNRGVSLTLSTLSNAIHNVTFYARGNAAATIQITLDAASNWNACPVIGGSTGAWVRYGVQVPAAQANGSTSCIVRNTANETWYLDDIQVEATTGYYTTFIWGDGEGLYKWTGMRNASTSTRDSQERSGGRERPLLADYSITVRDMPGFGVAPVQNNSQDLALQPGQLFQSYKFLPRTLSLVIDPMQTTMAGLHTRRKNFIDVVKPNAVRGPQPFTLGYSGADSTTKVYGRFIYQSGLEGLSIEGGGYKTEGGLQVPLNVTAYDPFWWEDSTDTTAIDYQDSLSNVQGGARRYGGQWKAQGTGFNSSVTQVLTDNAHGRIYYIGTFTSADGATQNRICYWNGANFVAMGSGLGATPLCMALAPNGDLWVGGSFTTVDGGASRNNIARWNYSTSTWTNFGTTGTGTVYSICIDLSGNVYAFGAFTNWGGDADQDYVTKYNGSAWVDVGTSPFSGTTYPQWYQASAVDASGNVWVGEYTSTTSCAIRKWDGSTWTSVLTATHASATRIFCLAFRKDGNLLVGGQYTALGGTTVTNIALYNLSSVVALSTWSGNPIPLGIKQLSDNTFIMASDNNGAADALILYNGITFVRTDTVIATVTAYSVDEYQKDWYIGYTAPTSTATAAGITTVTNSGTTDAFPVFTLANKNTSGSCTLYWLENQTTDERMFFTMVVRAGETITIDLRKNRKRVVSDWIGEIFSQPLQASDDATFHLQAGNNTIAAFITGTVTSVSLLCNSTPLHLSVDGAA